jgi:hypothetical protein
MFQTLILAQGWIMSGEKSIFLPEQISCFFFLKISVSLVDADQYVLQLHPFRKTLNNIMI